MKHNFPYKWSLKDAVFTKDKGKVFRFTYNKLALALNKIGGKNE